MTTNAKPVNLRDWEVRAILDGRKTMMRVVVKPQSAILTDGMARALGVRPPTTENQPVVTCPLGSPGSRLWVRECWMLFDEKTSHKHYVGYRADLDECGQVPVRMGCEMICCTPKDKWRSSTQMPRWASRLTIEIVSVRVERLQGIHHNVKELFAEGIEMPSHELYPDVNAADKLEREFSNQWDIDHGKGSWAANPWVWVIAFRRVM